MDFLQAVAAVRPGYGFSEGSDEDGYNSVKVVGERGNQVLLRGGETPGWWPRADIAALIAGANPLQSLRMRHADRRGAVCARLVLP